MKDAKGEIAGEAEGQEAATSIERESFCVTDADERGEAADLACDVGGLLLERGCVGDTGVSMTEDTGPTEADAGAEAGLCGEQLDDATGIE